MIVRALATPVDRGGVPLTHCRVLQVVDDPKRKCFRTVYALGTVEDGAFVQREVFHDDAEDVAELQHQITKQPIIAASSAYSALAQPVTDETKLALLQTRGKIGPGTKLTLAEAQAEPEIEP